MVSTVLASLLAVNSALAAQPQASEPLLIIRPDALHTLVNPMCSHCRDEAKRRAGELRPDDRVLCWIRGYSDGGAIPMRFFLHAFPVISDTYGVFVYDADAGFARGFAPSVDFTFHGWRKGVMVIKHKDGTLYSGLTGEAFAGPKKGTRLEPIPTVVTDWGLWLGRYPHNVAYHMFDRYRPTELPSSVHTDSVKSRLPADDRLPPDTAVLGVRAGGEERAYPLAQLAEQHLVADTLAGRPIIVVWYAPTRTAVAYEPLASPAKPAEGKPQPVTLEYDSKVPEAPFRDRQTGSHWDIAGRAVAGPLQGWTLTWLDGTQVKWFAWAAEYPQTRIYAR
jgi:hypothetical protein